MAGSKNMTPEQCDKAIQGSALEIYENVERARYQIAIMTIL